MRNLDPTDLDPVRGISPRLKKKIKISGKILSKYTNSKLWRNAYIHDKEIIPAVLNRAFHQLYILEPHEWVIPFGRFQFGKIWKIWEKRSVGLELLPTCPRAL